MRAVSPLHDPEVRKELEDHPAWLWEEVCMALVALARAREVMEALEEVPLGRLAPSGNAPERPRPLSPQAVGQAGLEDAV